MASNMARTARCFSSPWGSGACSVRATEANLRRSLRNRRGGAGQFVLGDAVAAADLDERDAAGVLPRRHPAQELIGISIPAGQVDHHQIGPSLLDPLPGRRSYTAVIESDD